MLSRRALLAGGVASLGRALRSSPSPKLDRQRRGRRQRSCGFTAADRGERQTRLGLRHPPADGTSGLTTKVGKTFRVRVENQIDEPSLIHWHGLTPPWQQDGVPGISGPPIPPGGNADYDFPCFGGTFWMHSHQGLQEQSLMPAPLIIHDSATGRASRKSC